MIVDAHYHLEEQIETVEVLLEQMQKQSVERVALIPKINEPFQLKPIPKKAGGLLPPLLMSRLRFLGLLLYNSTVASDGKLSTLGTKYLLYPNLIIRTFSVLSENIPTSSLAGYLSTRRPWIQ